jgi:uncharacterized protein (DUF2267 family)
MVPMVVLLLLPKSLTAAEPSRAEATLEEVLKDIFGDGFTEEEEDTVPSEDKMEDASQMDWDLFGTETDYYDGRPVW